jgi:hypothetical protein
VIGACGLRSSEFGGRDTNGGELRHRAAKSCRLDSLKWGIAYADFVHRQGFRPTSVGKVFCLPLQPQGSHVLQVLNSPPLGTRYLTASRNTALLDFRDFRGQYTDLRRLPLSSVEPRRPLRQLFSRPVRGSERRGVGGLANPGFAPGARAHRRPAGAARGRLLLRHLVTKNKNTRRPRSAVNCGW